MNKIIEKINDLSLSYRGILLYNKLFSSSQYFPISELQQYQIDCLKKLLIETYENIKFYRDLFWHHDFDPYKDFKTLEDIKRLPLLTKEKARRNQSRLANDNKIKNALELRTSGSTGEIFKEYVSRYQWIIEQGIVWRHWKWLNYKFRDRMAIVRSYVPDKGEPLWKLDRARNFLYFSAYHLTPGNAERYLMVMQKWKPTILRGYPASLYILARISEEKRINIPPLKGVLTASEMLLPHYRDAIERAFNAKVFDWYGQAETTVTMNECEAHEGMHINMEYGLCELLPDSSLNDNERRIVATNLHNDAMPLIRYDTGDIAVLHEKEDSCLCGRTLPLIKYIKGRSDDFLYAPEGRIIPSVNLYTMMYHFDHIISFQFIQNDKKSLEIRIKGNSINSQDVSQLEHEIKNRFGNGIDLSISQSGDFIQTEEGKKNPIISRVKHDL